MKTCNRNSSHSCQIQQIRKSIHFPLEWRKNPSSGISRQKLKLQQIPRPGAKALVQYSPCYEKFIENTKIYFQTHHSMIHILMIPRPPCTSHVIPVIFVIIPPPHPSPAPPKIDETQSAFVTRSVTISVLNASATIYLKKAMNDLRAKHCWPRHCSLEVCPKYENTPKNLTTQSTVSTSWIFQTHLAESVSSSCE